MIKALTTRHQDMQHTSREADRHTVLRACRHTHIIIDMSMYKYLDIREEVAGQEEIVSSYNIRELILKKCNTR